jgi:hypothetical protein
MKSAMVLMASFLATLRSSFGKSIGHYGSFLSILKYLLLKPMINFRRGQHLLLFFERGQIIVIFALVHFTRVIVALVQIKLKSSYEIQPA